MGRAILLSTAIVLFSLTINAQALPRPDHIVVVILENHAYQEVIGSSHAPHINALAGDPDAAVFTNCFAITHPSQPNYLYFFSGSNQHCTDDGLPGGPFTTANLGAELIAAGKSFATYSEGLPAVGYTGARSGSYASKHNPAINWLGSGTNQLPVSVSQPLSAFPAASGYPSLPTISYVVPNLADDMHNGPFPNNIINGDTWVYRHLDSLRQWALKNNTLFVITFDEDDDLYNNQILTLFYGPMVKGGKYGDKIDLITILRTFEDMYGLGHAGKSATYSPIVNCWK